MELELLSSSRMDRIEKVDLRGALLLLLSLPPLLLLTLLLGILGPDN